MHPFILLALNCLEGFYHALVLCEGFHIGPGVWHRGRDPSFGTLPEIYNLWKRLFIEKPPLYFVWEKVGILAFVVRLNSKPWSVSQPSTHLIPFTIYILIEACSLTPLVLKQICLFTYPHQLKHPVLHKDSARRLPTLWHPKSSLTKHTEWSPFPCHVTEHQPWVREMESGESCVCWEATYFLCFIHSVLLFSCFSPTKEGA